MAWGLWRKSADDAVFFLPSFSALRRCRVLFFRKFLLLLFRKDSATYAHLLGFARCLPFAPSFNA